MTTIDELEAKRQVSELIDRYATSYNRRDWKTVFNCFLPEVTFVETAPLNITINNLEEYKRVDHDAQMKAWVLLMSSRVIIVEGDTAHATVMVHETGHTLNDEDMDVVGMYEQRIVRRDGAWYFAQILFHPLVLRLPASFTTVVEGSSPIGTRWP